MLKNGIKAIKQNGLFYFQILMIPTLTASIYGMNIELPFQHSPHAFFIVTGISFSASLLCVLIFFKNRWF